MVLERKKKSVEKSHQENNGFVKSKIKNQIKKLFKSNFQKISRTNLNK
jgi:hypothetical protein